MPTYDIKCNKCGKVLEVYRRLKDWGNWDYCCDTQMQLVLTPINIQPDNTCYRSMITGEMITSKNRHKAHLKQHGVIEVGNETVMPKKPDDKKDKYELRKEIAQRLDTLPR